MRVTFLISGANGCGTTSVYPSLLVDGQALGVGALRRPQDLAVGPDQKVFIADSGNNRIIRLSAELELELVQPL